MADVDADDFAAQVDQRAAGVAGIDRGVGLEKVALVVGERAFLGGNDPLGDGLAEAEGIAHGEHDLADLDLRWSRRV